MLKLRPATSVPGVRDAHLRLSDVPLMPQDKIAYHWNAEKKCYDETGATSDDDDDCC